MVHLKGFFKIGVYLPAVIPAVAVYMIWYYLYLPGESGLLNMILNHLGMDSLGWLQDKRYTILLMIVSSTWHSFGINTIMYLAAMQGINGELYEACKIDGGGVLTRIRVVLLPHMFGIMLLLMIRQIIRVFQIMEMPLIMTGGGPNKASMSLALQSYVYAFEYSQIDKGLALGVITFLILISLTIVYMWFDKKLSN